MTSNLDSLLQHLADRRRNRAGAGADDNDIFNWVPNEDSDSDSGSFDAEYDTADSAKYDAEYGADSVKHLEPTHPSQPMEPMRFYDINGITQKRLRRYVRNDLAYWGFIPNMMEKIIIKYIFAAREAIAKGHKVKTINAENIVFHPNIRPEFWLAIYRAYKYLDVIGYEKTINLIQTNNKSLFGNRTLFEPCLHPHLTPSIIQKYMHCKYFHWNDRAEELFDMNIITLDWLYECDVSLDIVKALINQSNEKIYLKYMHKLADANIWIRMPALWDMGIITNDTLLHNNIPHSQIKSLQDVVNVDVLQKYEDVWDYNTILNPNMDWDLFNRHCSLDNLPHRTWTMLSYCAPLEFIYRNYHEHWSIPVILTRQISPDIKSAQKE